jgi:hypothetical protein
MELDGNTVSAILIGVGALLTFLVSQSSTRARDQRRRLRRLTKRDILWSSWSHKVHVWAAGNGYDDLPVQPALLSIDEEDEDDA